MIASLLRRAWQLARWLVRLEIGIWRSLFLLVTRRVPGLGPGAQAFSYAADVVPILAAFIFVSLVEVPIVHLLLPWETVRLVALVVSVWGLLWMIGLLASMKMFPHLLDGTGLRIRSGTSADIRIPWEAVATVTARLRTAEGRKHVHVERGDDGAVAAVPILKTTTVEVALARPTRVDLPDGAEDIVALRFHADDPRALVRAARERLAGRTAPEPAYLRR